jgi:chemotaxis protein methyltransferase CheR
MTETIDTLRAVVEELMGARPNGLVVRDLAQRLRAIGRRVGDARQLEVARAIREASPQDEVFSAAVSELTIGETWFFRDPALFRFLEETVFPVLRDRPGTVRIWSAGCSTGEETHSLAFTARRALRAPLEVLGTDLDAERLAVARSRRYMSRSARGVALPPFFSMQVMGTIVVRDPADAKVTFIQHNLARDPAPRACSVDLIVCRNVLLYFHAAAVEHALSVFADALVDGGWLLLGPSDVIDRPEIVPRWFESARGWPTLFRYRRQARSELGQPEKSAAPPRPSPAPTSAPPARLPDALAAATPPAGTPLDRNRYRLRLAQAHLDRGDDRAAEDACLAVLEEDGANLDAAILIARIAVARGESTLARHLLGALREHHPDDARVRRALEEVDRNGGDRGSA